MEQQTSLLDVLIGWTALFAILLVYWFMSRRQLKRLSESNQVGHENTEAVRQNTETLKALIEELRRNRGG